MGDRLLLYVHDLFLLTRREELNARARAYMAPSFALAMRTVRRFFTNSLTTAAELRAGTTLAVEGTDIARDPAAGTTVTSAPQRLTLTFSAPMLDVGGQVAGKGPDGKTKQGTPKADGQRVTVPFEPTGNGTYAVTWRVTSSDGHPISGSYSFTLKGAANSSTSTGTSTGSEAPGTLKPVDPSSPASSSTVKGPSTPTTDEPGDNMPLFVIGGTVAAAAAVAGTFLVMRKRTKDDPR